jgi:hypothetical protein
VARGRLHRIAHGVYAVGHLALSREGQFLAAVFAAGEGAALSHLAAAELWQVWRRRASLIDVVVPRRRRTRVSARLHECRGLSARDVTRHRNIPVTTIARTQVDLTDVLTPHQLAHAIHEAEFRGRFNLRATHDAMARANGRRNLHVLHKALELQAQGSAGTRSGNEDHFLHLLQLAGLPEPLVNTELHGTEPDCHWPDHLLAVEIDGPGHTRPRTQREDADKERTLREAGYQVLRFTEDELKTRPEWIVSEVAACL